MTDAKEKNIKDILGTDAASQEVAEKAVAEAKKDLDEEMRQRKIKLIKLGSIMLFISIIMVMMTIAWFSNNKSVNANIVGVTAKDMPFELKTAGSTGLYDSYLDDVAPGYGSGTTTTGTQGIKWKLTANSSEMKNFYTGSGTPDLAEITKRDSEDYGLKPGDSGTLEFWIVPNSSESISVSLDLLVTGYEAKFDVRNYKTEDDLTKITDSTLNNYLASHILFFYMGTDNHKHLLTSDGFDSDNITESERKVTLYWVWPATLQEILDANIAALNDSTASLEVRRYFFENPEHFLKATGDVSFSGFKVSKNSNTAAEETTISEKLSLVTGRNYSQYGSMYNDADQSIGDNVNYILVELFAVQK